MAGHGWIAGIAAGCALALLLGCAPEPESRGDADAVPPTSTTTTSSRLPPTTVLASSTTTLFPAPETPDQARRLLEREGVDPAALSREIGEHMQRRFRPPLAE